MQLARVIRLSVNKSYQFIILEVRDATRARAAVFTLYVQSSNLHIKSCRQCYCARWCIQTSPEVRWNYSVRHLPNMILSLQFLVLLWKIMFQVTIWAWTNHIDVHGPRTLRCMFNSCDAWRIIIPFYNNSAIYTVISLNRPKPPFPLRCNFTRYIFTFSIILVTNFPHPYNCCCTWLSHYVSIQH